MHVSDLIWTKLLRGSDRWRTHLPLFHVLESLGHARQTFRQNEFRRWLDLARSENVVDELPIPEAELESFGSGRPFAWEVVLL